MGTKGNESDASIQNTFDAEVEKGAAGAVKRRIKGTANARDSGGMGLGGIRAEMAALRAELGEDGDASFTPLSKETLRAFYR